MSPSRRTVARVLVLTPDSNAAIGGIKMHYQMVDALNRSGVEAWVVHRRPGFRCRWFHNATSVTPVPEVLVDGHDVIVVPEEWVGFIPDLPGGVPKIVFNQNAYTTFTWGLDAARTRSILERSDVRRVVVVSEDNARYMRYAFPNVCVGRVRYTIDQAVFHHSTDAPRRRQLAYVPRRRAMESGEVLSLLRCRGALTGWSIVAVENMDERQVADVLRTSAIFLSFSEREGFGLPPAEAMACGALVIGFDGFGGREFFDHAFSVPDGDVVGYAQTVESVLRTWDGDTERHRISTERAGALVADAYNAENTEADALAAPRMSSRSARSVKRARPTPPPSMRSACS